MDAARIGAAARPFRSGERRNGGAPTPELRKAGVTEKQGAGKGAGLLRGMCCQKNSRKNFLRFCGNFTE